MCSANLFLINTSFIHYLFGFFLILIIIPNYGTTLEEFCQSFGSTQRGEQPRREGVTLNRTVGEHPLPRHDPSNQAEGQSSRAPPEYREVIQIDLNIAQARETSARVVEVDSDSDVEFQDSREVLPTKSLADSIAVPRVPQITTTETT